MASQCVRPLKLRGAARGRQRRTEKGRDWGKGVDGRGCPKGKDGRRNEEGEWEGGRW